MQSYITLTEFFMKNKIIIILIPFLIFTGCSDKNVPKDCDPLKAVELLINYPPIEPSKTQAGYYEISGQDEAFIYFGYRKLSLKSAPKLDPYYKTNKKEYETILQKTAGINLLNAEAIVKAWYLKKNPELKQDSIKTAQIIEIKFQLNETTQQYDANCTGWIEFYAIQMEKSTAAGIDSTVVNHTIQKFDYQSLITDGKNIEWLKSNPDPSSLKTSTSPTNAAQPIKKDSLDIVFIGKTTQELNKYSLHSCFGTMLKEKSPTEKYAVSQYSLNRENCRNGKSKISLEKLKGYDNEGKANFEVKDELLVNQSAPKKYYTVMGLQLDKKQPTKTYLVAYEDNSEPTITKIDQLWEINLYTEKFVAVKVPENFKTHNPNYTDEF